MLNFSILDRRGMVSFAAILCMSRKALDKRCVTSSLTRLEKKNSININKNSKESAKQTSHSQAPFMAWHLPIHAVVPLAKTYPLPQIHSNEP